jgi:hypothetical protein
MEQPTLTDYVQTIYTLFAQFEQQQTTTKRGRPFTYAEQVLIVVFTILQLHRIYKFKAQRRWLEAHPALRAQLGLPALPHRTTLSRRYKALYSTIEEFVPFVSQYAATLDPAFRPAHLVTDKSLFKAQGPVWHQRDRAANHIPEKLRNLDTDATWSKSGYHGWVYGYGLHLTCNDAAFPTLVQVETGAVSESEVIDRQAEGLITDLAPETVAADNSYTQATRIRQWAKRGVALLTPAYQWVKGHYARAYHRFLKDPAVAAALRKRRTTIEPLFDLVAQVLGTTGQQKQLPVQGVRNVRSCLSLATLTVQIAMLVNSIWGLPLRNISVMLAACT